MNTYLISSTSYRLLQDEIIKIIKNSSNIIKFDYEEDSFENILEEASYFSLLDEKKYIIVYNANLFSSDKLNEEKSEILLKYFKEPNVNSVLIFTLYRPIDSRKAVTKYIEKNGTIIVKDTPNEREMANIISSLLKKESFKISYGGINYLINNCRNDYDIILSEIEKIKIYLGEKN